MARCKGCQKKLDDWINSNLCPLCANTLPPGHPAWSEVKVRYEGDGYRYVPFMPGRVSTEAKLKFTLQDAAAVQPASHPSLKTNLASWIAPMCIYLDSRGCWDATEETNVGEQCTPANCKVGTVSLDFQGVRKNTGGICWIDLQGQVGGGSGKRLTFCQVMIQTCVGGPVSQNLILEALLASLKDGAKRAVIHIDGKADRPK